MHGQSDRDRVWWAVPTVAAVRARVLAALLAAGALAACGGGGDAAPGASPTPGAPPTPAGPSTPAGPTTPPLAAVPTLPAVTPRQLGAADCARLADPAAARAAFAPTDPDTRQVRDLLRIASPTHGEAILAVAPEQTMYWVRAAGRIDFSSIAGAVHEGNHLVNMALQIPCDPQGAARYFLEGAVHRTSLSFAAPTPPARIAAFSVPDPLKGRFRYRAYVADAPTGNDFSTLLEEFNAYAGAAALEIGMLAGLDRRVHAAFLPEAGVLVDSDPGGLADFQLYVLAYLKSVREREPASYATIAGQPDTLAHLQRLWSRSEELLLAVHPYTQGAGGPLVVPRDVLAATYSPDLLGELGRLGIRHRTAADFASTYLR